METSQPPTIFIVDDDPLVRRSLARLIRSKGMNVETFASAKAFWAIDSRNRPGCIILDVRMPGLSGLGLQARLATRSGIPPIIFLTGYGDVPMSVCAMKSGAVDFLVKPVSPKQLLAAVHQALHRDRQDRGLLAQVSQARQRAQSLTPREREVLAMVVQGCLNKQIAAELNITEKTVKFHRASVMKKMKVTSVPDLVRAAEKAGVEPRSTRDS